MKRFCLAVLLLFGLSSGAKLPAAAPARPALAVLPLKEEGRKALGDVSETMNAMVDNAFADSGAFRLVERGQVLAALGGPEAGRGAADVGRRVGAQYVLSGSFLPEYTLASGTVTVTVTLRLVDAADGAVLKNIQEVGSGASLGAVVAVLGRQLSAKAAEAGSAAQAAAVPPAPAPAVAAPPAPAPAVVAVPAPAPAPAVVAVPAPVPVPAVAAPPAPVPAPAVAAPPAPVPAPPVAFHPYAPAAAAGEPAPRKAAKVLLVLREGMVNGIYYQRGGLARFGVQLGDFDFLLKSVARLFPADTDLAFDIGTRGFGDDTTLDRALVKKNQADTLVVVSLDLNTRLKPHLLLLNTTLLQAVARVDFMDADSLAVLGSEKVETGFTEAKGVGEKFPPVLREELADRMAKQLRALPY